MALSVPTRAGGPVAAINVTPLADVMIVLLIIFMVAVQVLDRDGGLQLPPATQARSQRPEAGALTLALRADGSVWLNGLPAPPRDELREQLRERLAGAAARGTVWLKADQALPYESVDDLLGLCREAGAESIALAAEPVPRS